VSNLDVAFSTAIASGRMILVLGDLAGGQFFADGAGPVTLGELKSRLLKLAGLGHVNDARTSLAEALTFARAENAQGTNELIRTHLSTEGRAETPLWRLLTGPFERIYDLAGQGGYGNLLAGDALKKVGIVSEETPLEHDEKRNQVIGLCGDYATPDSVSFSARADRTPAGDAWYGQLCADLAMRPTLVVCSQAHDELLDFLAARPGVEFDGLRGPAFWVSDLQDDVLARRLGQLGITPIETTSGDFSTGYLSPGRQEVVSGHKSLARLRVAENRLVGATDMSRILRESHSSDWNFLRGHDPHWGDVIDRRLVRFKLISRIRRDANLEAGSRNKVLLTGRAGSGKTAALMQLAVEYHAQGHRVYWIDREANLSVSAIIDAVTEAAPDVVMVDNLDLFGERTDEAARKFNRNGKTLVIGTVRTTQFWAVTNRAGYELVSADEPLTDHDLEGLAKALETAGLLGSLIGVNPKQARVDSLRAMCERDLLAALIQVVTGVPFDERIESEYAQLNASEQWAYSLICFASAKIFESPWLPTDHLLQMMGGDPPYHQHMTSLQGLIDCSLVTVSQEGLRPRHRAIADAVVRGLGAEKEYLASVVHQMLAFYARYGASRLPASHPNRRRLISLLSHTLMRDLSLPIDSVRALYESVQPHLMEDKHFWLQRGAYEVERGDLDLADSYLESARACSGGETDYKITTEWGLMRLVKARRSPSDAQVQERAYLALSALREVALREGKSSPHTFTVIVRDGTLWLNAKPVLSQVRREDAISYIKEACGVGAKVCKDNREVMKIIAKHEPMLKELSIGSVAEESKKPPFPL
jgi:hypothetical protein